MNEATDRRRKLERRAKEDRRRGDLFSSANLELALTELNEERARRRPPSCAVRPCDTRYCQDCLVGPNDCVRQLRAYVQTLESE
jgi:hypothetical protein